MQPTKPVEEDEKISRFIGTIVESAIAALIHEFDTECMKAFQNTETMETTKSFHAAYKTFKLYTFCTDESLQSINMLFMRDPLTIDFVMNVTERTVFAWNGMDDTLFMDMVRVVLQTQKQMKGASSNGLVLSPQLVSSLEIDEKKVQEIFINNPVLLVLYVLFANFRQTMLYKIVSETEFKEHLRSSLISQQPTAG